MAKKNHNDEHRPDGQETPLEENGVFPEDGAYPDSGGPTPGEEAVSEDGAYPGGDETTAGDEAAPQEDDVPSADGPVFTPDAAVPEEENVTVDDLFPDEELTSGGIKGKLSGLLAGARSGAGAVKGKLSAAVSKHPGSGKGKRTEEQKAELRERALVLRAKAKAQMQKSVEGDIHMPSAPVHPDFAGRTAPTVGRTLKNNEMLVYDSELDEIDYTDDEDLPELRDYMPVRFRRYGRSGVGGAVLYALFVISVSIILACFAWMCAVDVLALNKELVEMPVTIEPYRPTGDMPTTVTMEDENGDPEEVEIKVDIDQVADALKEAGIIEYKWLFKIFSQFSHANTKIDPGTYAVSTALDYRALVTVMQFGSDSQEVVQVTFPEGFSMQQVFTLLQSSNVSWSDDLYETAADYDFEYPFLEGVPLGDASRLEGFLFPDTYEFYQGEDPDVAIKRFLDNTANKLNEDVMAQVEASGRSLHDIITIASLIEKEAGAAEGEREKMASVIYNRLAADMPLQLDSTVNYVKGTSTLHLTIDDTRIDDPYNTYVYKGLPPGPICNPGMASINAALHPADTNYYYWYSVDGVSSFFTTLEEQQAYAHDHPF